MSAFAKPHSTAAKGRGAKPAVPSSSSLASLPSKLGVKDPKPFKFTTVGAMSKPGFAGGSGGSSLPHNRFQPKTGPGSAKAPNPSAFKIPVLNNASSDDMPAPRGFPKQKLSSLQSNLNFTKDALLKEANKTPLPKKNVRNEMIHLASPESGHVLEIPLLPKSSSFTGRGSLGLQISTPISQYKSGIRAEDSDSPEFQKQIATHVKDDGDVFQTSFDLDRPDATCNWSNAYGYGNDTDSQSSLPNVNLETSQSHINSLKKSVSGIKRFRLGSAEEHISLGSSQGFAIQKNIHCSVFQTPVAPFSHRSALPSPQESPSPSQSSFFPSKNDPMDMDINFQEMEEEQFQHISQVSLAPGLSDPLNQSFTSLFSSLQAVIESSHASNKSTTDLQQYTSTLESKLKGKDKTIERWKRATLKLKGAMEVYNAQALVFQARYESIEKDTKVFKVCFMRP